LYADDIRKGEKKRTKAQTKLPCAIQIALEESSGTRAVEIATPTAATLSRGEPMAYAPAARPLKAIRTVREQPGRSDWRYVTMPMDQARHQ